MIYKFSEHDIKSALMKYFNIPESRGSELNLYEPYSDNPQCAELIVTYAEKKENSEKDE